MQIMSQREDLLFSRVMAVLWRQDNFIYADICGKTRMIGEYGTEKRAIEVFREIRDYQGTVYEMPKE